MGEMNEIQKEILLNKQRRGFNTSDLGKEIVLMAEELGELAKAYKKSDKKPIGEINNREEIIDAIGDLMVYCLGLCEMLGVDATEVISSIVNNNKTRSHSGFL